MRSLLQPYEPLHNAQRLDNTCKRVLEYSTIPFLTIILVVFYGVTYFLKGANRNDHIDHCRYAAKYEDKPNGSGTGKATEQFRI